MKFLLLLGLFFFPCFAEVFQLGVESLSSDFVAWLADQRVGLVTNQTGVDQSGKRTVDILKQKGVKVRVIFAPEHGVTGAIAAEKEVKDVVDINTSIPVTSLYVGDTGKKITQQTVDLVDVIIFDIQDSGMRHYTYISTLLHIMTAAAHFKKKVVVFDRPNPLGAIMEGPLVDNGLISFISIASVPVRHGMTIGELALYFNKNILHDAVELHVIKMKGYDRSIGIGGRLSVGLSPNIQNIQSCYGYSFLGLLGEVEPFHVGVGTDKAFQCIMISEKMKLDATVWQKLQKLLRDMNINASPYRYYNEKKKDWFKGLALQIADINTVHAFTTFVSVLLLFKKAGVTLSFAVNFHKAVGTYAVRDFLAGSLSAVFFAKKINDDLDSFYKKAQFAFLYQPRPVVVHLPILS